MSLTQLAIQNNRTTLVILVLILLAGLQTYRDMPRAYDPGFIIRTAQVVTQFPGASPERVEQLISSKIEEVVRQIPELDFVKSESRTGVSIVSVNIKESFSQMRPIWDSLRRKIDAVTPELPEGIIGPQVNDEFGDVFGVVVTLTGEGFDYAELKQVADEVRGQLLHLSETAKVEIHGEQPQRVFVEYNNARLAELGLSSGQLQQSLASRNIVIPGGALTLGPERIELEPSGDFTSVEDISRTVLHIPGSSQVVYLGDIAQVRRSYIDPPAPMVRSSAAPALALAISMRSGGNNILLGAQVKQLLAELQSAYPYGIEFDIVNFSPAEVATKVNGFTVSLLQAIAVVASVMIFSLGLRTGAVVLVLIPASMMAAILVMSLLGIGLDQISLAALIIAMGMLVDNGIVMSESIVVQMAAGKKAVAAAIDSAAELKLPLLTSSLTTSAAFLPIFLAESSTGEFTASLFKVVTITLLCSWLLSLTVIPLLCIKLLRVSTAEVCFESSFYRRYRRFLLLLLRYRAATLAAVVALFVVALMAFSYVPKLFFPPSDRLYFTMELELPLGSTIERTEAVVAALDGYIAAELQRNAERAEGVTNWVSYIGSGGVRFVLNHSPKPAGEHYALSIINVSSVELIAPLMSSLEARVYNHFPEVKLTLKRISSGGVVANPVEVRLSGGDSRQVFALVDALSAEMTSMPSLKNIADDWGARRKKLLVAIDQERAYRAGVTSQDIAASLQASLSGAQLTQYREGEDIIPVILRSQSADRQTIGQLEALAIASQATGLSVPLRQVADIKVVWEAAKVLRRDGLTTVTVGAQMRDGYTAAEAFARLTPWLEQQQRQWPPGSRYQLGGDAESSAKANQSIADKLPIAGLIILLLLVGQFNSLRQSSIILLTIPLALIGVVAGLLLANSFFGFMALLGVISLVGIVINNAIVLLERIRLEIEAGLAPCMAILAAAQQRLRPILLTTATTVMGLLPLYLGGGEMWEPMAITIMVGLAFSTLLTLGVVPVLYSLFYRVPITAELE